jgi:hypothetical protein
MTTSMSIQRAVFTHQKDVELSCERYIPRVGRAQAPIKQG